MKLDLLLNQNDHSSFSYFFISSKFWSHIQFLALKTWFNSLLGFEQIYCTLLLYIFFVYPNILGKNAKNKFSAFKILVIFICLLKHCFKTRRIVYNCTNIWAKNTNKICIKVYIYVKNKNPKAFSVKKT